MQHIASLLQQFGLLILVLNVLLEQAGLPLPSYPMLIVAGALTFTGGSLAPAVIAAAAAAMVADLGWYLAGLRWGGKVLGTVCRVSLSPDSCVRQTQSLFSRAGPKALLFVKFLPGIGLVTVAMSGISGVSLQTFLLFDAIGAGLFVSVPIVLGRVFHGAVDVLLATIAQLGQYGAILLVAAFALYVCVRWIKRRLFMRQLRMDRISVAELAELINGGKTPVIFDVRPADARLRDGVIPGSLYVPFDVTKTLDKYPRDAEIVVYCACPNEASAAVVAQQFKRAGFKTIRPLLGGIDAWAQAGLPIVAPA
jgi:membrane protein DedA with SNARE-associated domain/rhodanese-related sulfurtransferase